MSNTSGVLSDTRTDYPLRALGVSFLVLCVVFLLCMLSTMLYVPSVSPLFSEVGLVLSIVLYVFTFLIPYCVFRYDSGIENDVRFVFALSCL